MVNIIDNMSEMFDNDLDIRQIMIKLNKLEDMKSTQTQPDTERQMLDEGDIHSNNSFENKKDEL